MKRLFKKLNNIYLDIYLVEKSLRTLNLHKLPTLV